jgi:4-hydroxy-tetrahydrodipicolinate synthase
LYNAASSKNIDQVRVLQSKVMQICSTIYSNGKYGSSYLKGLKCGLSVLGICSDYLAAPFTSFDQQHKELVIQAIKELQV